jgi:hypothetical protein
VPTDAVALVVDLNTMDDSGLPWAFLDEAVDPSRVQPGRYLLGHELHARNR